MPAALLPLAPAFEDDLVAGKRPVGEHQREARPGPGNLRHPGVDHGVGAGHQGLLEEAGGRIVEHPTALVTIDHDLRCSREAAARPNERQTRILLG